MSIANYSQLKSAMYRLFHRSDIDAWIQDSVDVNTRELAAALNAWETQGAIEIADGVRPKGIVGLGSKRDSLAQHEHDRMPDARAGKS